MDTKNQAQISPKIKAWMQIALFCVFLAIFMATSVLTLCALFFDFGALSETQVNTLSSACLIQVAVGIVYLFYRIFGLGRPPAKSPLE